MPGVQFSNQIDMNGWKVTEVAPGTDPTDAVTLAQLTAAIGGYKTTIGDGIASSFTIPHALNTLDTVVQVVRISDGATVMVDVTGRTLTAVTITFGGIITTNSHRVLVLPVR